MNALVQNNSRNCPICGASHNAVPYADRRIDESKLSSFSFASRKLPEYMHHTLKLCRNCDLLFAIPDATLNLHAAYESAAYDSNTEAVFAAATYRRILQPVLDRIPHKTRLLDIGAGDGAFLREMLSAGFTELIGLEPSSAPIHAAHPSIRSCLRMEMFREGLFEPNSFSLITCFQTIEHVPDPLALCIEAEKLLKPGGFLAIIAHNRQGLLNRILGKKSPIFDIEHLQLFSPNSLHKLLEKSGFRNISTRPFRNTYPLAYWARLFPFPTPVKEPLLKVVRATLGNTPVSLPVGNLLCIASRAPLDSPHPGTSASEPV